MNPDLDQDSLLDCLEMDQDTFDALDLHKPEILHGLIADTFGADMMQHLPPEDAYAGDDHGEA